MLVFSAGSLRPSASSALKMILNAENAEIRRGPQSYFFTLISNSRGQSLPVTKSLLLA
jgi:hypothetical protein